MKTQGLPGFMSDELTKKLLVFLTIVAYAGIHQYDGKWNLPILAWQLIGLVAGSALIKIVSGLMMLCWLYDADPSEPSGGRAPPPENCRTGGPVKTSSIY
jgi:hypothetical protein